MLCFFLQKQSHYFSNDPRIQLSVLCTVQVHCTVHHFAVYSLLYNVWSWYMYSVSTQQVSTQAVNRFIKILILKGENTGEI